MDELTRFARRLVEQLTASKDGVNRQVPVGQIRDKILPYRRHRQALQLDSVEDYETVLLRLVAGERGFVRTLPEAVGERCRKELASANPDLAILDQVADATIQVTSLAAARIVADERADGIPAAEETAPPTPPEPALSTPAAAPLPAPEPPPPPPPPPTMTPPAREPVMTAASAASPADSCPQCHHAMPGGRQVVFCPWCGQRVIPFACPRCRTELDSEWRHCITCGAPVKDPFRFV